MEILQYILADTKATEKIIARILKAFKGRDLGEAKWLLGMELIRDYETRTLHISQRRMIINMLERFGYTNANGMPTPLESGTDRDRSH